jgi:hypothetical protein
VNKRSRIPFLLGWKGVSSVGAKLPPEEASVKKSMRTRHSGGISVAPLTRSARGASTAATAT